MTLNNIIHGNIENKKFIVIQNNSSVTIPIEYNNIVNVSMNSIILKNNENKLLAFLGPLLADNGNVINNITKQTKRIKITFNITIKNDKTHIEIVFESFFKKLLEKDILKDSIELKSYYGNEELAKISREIIIPEEGIINIPTEFNHIGKSSYDTLEMCHYKSPVNVLKIKGKAPVINIIPCIINRKNFKLMTNLNKKVIKLNKSKFKSIDIIINLEIDLTHKNPFSKIIRRITYMPVLENK